MAWDQSSGEPFGSYYQEDALINAPSGKRPRAPFELLAIGMVFLLALLALRVFGPAEWGFDILFSLGFWIGSLFAFLVPFAIYSELNLARQLNPDYRSNKQTARNAVFAFVIFGFATSLVHMFYLSSLLARLLNVE